MNKYHLYMSIGNKNRQYHSNNSGCVLRVLFDFEANYYYELKRDNFLVTLYEGKKMIVCRDLYDVENLIEYLKLQ